MERRKKEVQGGKKEVEGLPLRERKDRWEGGMDGWEENGRRGREWKEGKWRKGRKERESSKEKDGDVKKRF